MSWAIKPLSELANFCLGKMLDEKKNRGELRPYLANVNVRWGEFDLLELREMRFEHHELERYGLQFGDIIMCEGGEPGRCAIWKAPNPGMMIQKALHRIRPNAELDNRFLYYSFLHLGKRGAFKPYFTGATIKHLPREKLAKVEIAFPALPVQKRIADYLSTYDDLIENNRRRIQLLEESARLLYREWFVHLRFPGHEHVKIVDGVPEGWKSSSIANLLTNVKRKAKIKKEDYQESGLIPCVDQSRDLIGGYTDDLSAAITEDLPVVVFGDHTRIVKFVDFPFAPGADGTQILIPINESIPRIFFYFLISSANVANAFYARHFKFLKAKETLIPPENLMARFESLVQANMAQITKLREYNRKLIEVRDLLLPRLMSRELSL